MIRHSEAQSRPLVWLWLVLGAVTIASSVRAVGVATESASLGYAVADVSWVALAPLFAALGIVISTRQRGNRIGWLLMLSGVGLTLDATVGPKLDSAPGAMTAGLFVQLWVGGMAWMAFLFPMFLLLYIFPTGKLLSRKWLWAPRLLIAMTATMLLLGAFLSETGPADETWTMPNPVGFLEPAMVDLISIPWFVALLVVVGGGIVAMVVRYRSSSYVEKTQIKWFVLTMAVFVFVFAFSFIFEVWTSDSYLAVIPLALAIALIPVSITIGILKYRLFDIDVIISRSLMYGALASFIGAVYIGIVVGIGGLFGRGDSTNFGLSIAATALVAIAFQPVRMRVERWANRAVYGERATPYEVLAQFSRRSAEVPDDELLARIPHLIVDGTGASRAALWVRSEDGFSTASSWPETEAIGTLPAHDVFTDPDADYSVSVFHDGELLGGISLVKARGETIAPTEEELLANLAGGMGLALRNTQLTARLRQQVLDLTRSRDRIVSAADQARRSLEHDLDSGPQQQLVAVKVKLGPTRVLAEKAGAEKTAKILADIEAQAGEAIQAIRDFAGGIYPPLLEAEGLGVALGQQTRRAALPILVHADQIGRYPREVEAAVYFTVLEALQNTAKYADASSAEVTLTDQNGAVLFEVRDDGRGFDPDAAKAGAGLNGIDDRMDSVGGLWRIESKPGSGTILSGSVPVNEKANA